MPQDSTGNRIDIGYKVCFRGKVYTIKHFPIKAGLCHIDFEEEQHTPENATEMSVDLVDATPEDTSKHDFAVVYALGRKFRFMLTTDAAGRRLVCMFISGKRHSVWEIARPLGSLSSIDGDYSPAVRHGIMLFKSWVVGDRTKPINIYFNRRGDKFRW